MVNGKKKVIKSFNQDKGHKAEMEMLIKTVKKGAPIPISFDSLYATTIATFKVHESIKRNTLVSLINNQ